MITADPIHKKTVVEILSRSFDDNKSINYIAKQDEKRQQRIRSLMSYSFDICMEKGHIFLSEDASACVLILDPSRRMNPVKKAILDLQLAVQCIGMERIGKVMEREKLIKAHQPVVPFYYLWFMGVMPESQGKGVGSKLMEEVLQHYDHDRRPFYLETSAERNLGWYEKFGFSIFNEIDIGYKLYQMLRP